MTDSTTAATPAAPSILDTLAQFAKQNAAATNSPAPEPPAAPAPSAAPSAQQIPQDHIDYLVAHPNLADSFDNHYGKGMAENILRAHRSAFTDVARGAVHGFLGALDETSKTVVHGINGASAMAGGDPNLLPEPLSYRNIISGKDEVPFTGGEHVDLVDKPVTRAGNIAEGVSQFATEYMLVSRLLNATPGVAGLMQKAGKGLLSTSIRGSIAALVGFDPYQSRLSNTLSDMMDKYPSLKPGIVDFLKADPADPEPVARVKNAIEQSLVAAGVEKALVPALMGGLRFVRGVVQGNPQEVAQAAQEGAQHAAGDAGKAVAKAQGASPAQAAPAGDAAGAGQEAVPAGEKPAAGSSNNELDTPPQGDTKTTLSPADAFNRERLREAYALSEKMAQTGARPPADSGLVDWSKMRTPEDVQRVFQAGDDIVPGASVARAGAKTATFEEVQKQADLLGQITMQRPDRMLQMAAQGAADSTQMAGRLTYNNMVLTSFFKRMQDLNTMLRAGVTKDPQGNSFASLDDVRKAMEDTLGLTRKAFEFAQGGRTGAGQTLNALKITKDDHELVRSVLGDAENAAGANVSREAADSGRVNPQRFQRLSNALAKAGDDPVGQAAALLSRSDGAFFRYWYNAMLSSPSTHVLVLANGLLNGLRQPVAQIMAGAGPALMGALRGEPGQAGQLIEGLGHFSNILGDAIDSAKAAGKAWVAGQNVLDPRHSVAPGAISVPATPIQDVVEHLRNLRIVPAALGALDHTLSAVGSRMTLLSDEMVQQFAYRSAVRGQAMREAYEAKAAGTLAPQDAQNFVRTRLAQAINPDGSAARSTITGDPVFPSQLLESQRALGKEAMYPGSLGYGVRQLVRNVPLMRLIDPFTTIPANLANQAWRMTPVLQELNPGWRAEWAAASPEQRNVMIAHTVIGALLWMHAFGLASNGELTGGGPSSGAMRTLNESGGSGWRPYSFVTTNADGTKTYRQFNRMDPFANVYGLAADMHDIYAMSGYRPREDLYLAALTGMARNFQDKAYLEGLTRFFDAMSNPDEGMGKLVNGLAGSLVPTALNPNKYPGEHALKAVRSAVDAIRARTPGLSDQLEPRRNVLGGIVMAPDTWGPHLASPIYENTDKAPGGGVERRLFNLAMRSGTTFEYPPTNENGVSLLDYKNAKGQTAYDRMLELIHDGAGPLPPIEDQLTAVMDRLDKEPISPTDKMAAVKTAMGAYWATAKAETFREYPQLYRDVWSAYQRQHGMIPNPQLQAADRASGLGPTPQQ